MLEKKLFDKEAELVHVNAEMKTIIDHLQLDMDMLRESNNQLVADLLRVEREKQVSENRLESDLIEVRTKADEEKASILQSHQEVLVSMQSEALLKEAAFTKLAEALSTAEEASRQQSEEKVLLFEQLKTEKENEISELTTAHNSAIAQLHRDYERVFGDKEEKFAAEMEKLQLTHRQMTEEVMKNGQAEREKLQADFQTSFANLQSKLEAEKQQQIEEYTQKIAEAENNFHFQLAAVQQQHEAAIQEITLKCQESENNVCTCLFNYLTIKSNLFLLI